jgi:phage gp46-like protein
VITPPNAPTDGLHRRWIDPITGQFSIVSGRSKADPTLATLIAFLLRMERGSCAWDPTIGSRLHTLRSATTQAAILAKAYAFEALKPLRSQGRLPGLSIDASFRSGAIYLLISWRGSDGRRVAPITYTRPVGA